MQKPRSFTVVIAGLNACRRIMLFAVVMMLITMACSDEPALTDPNDPNDPADPNEQENPVSAIDPDLAAEHLVLTNATKISGSLPSVSSGELKINVKDSIYVVKGYPYGDRISVLHDETQQVKGFYVGVKNSTFYFDVEESFVEDEGESDSISVVTLDLDLPDDVGESYPIAVTVIIQPHDETGVSLDEFERILVVEDPAQSSGSGRIASGGCNDIRTPPLSGFWSWDVTIRENTSGSYVLSASRVVFSPNDLAVGCCTLDGTMDWPPYNGCNKNSENWVEIPMDEYYIPLYEHLWFFENGTARVTFAEVKQFLDRPNTHLCEGELAYITSTPEVDGTGTHNFTPGATTLHLSFPNVSGFGKPPVNSEIAYTCHSLVMSFGSEADKFHKIYKNTGDTDPDGYNEEWFD